MDETESAPDQAIPESSETNEKMPEAEEQNDGIKEESNEDTNEPQESGITSQATEEEAALEQTSVKEVEEESNKETNEPQESGIISEVEEEEAGPEQIAVEVKEESNKETNEQESGITGQVTEEEAGLKQTSVEEAEEEPLIPNQETDIPGSRMSETASLQKEPLESSDEPCKSQKSIGQLSLQSGQSLPSQPTTVSDHQGKSTWINANTGKELQSRSIQTSLIWELKPLAEVLQASGWPVVHQVSEVAEKDMKEAKEITPAGDAEMEAEQLLYSFHSSLNVKEEKPQGESQPATVKEPELNNSEPEAQKQQSEDQVSLHDSQQFAGNQTRIPSPPQLTNERCNEENTVWINPKTGKEMKCSFNQTSLIWEKKPLADILHRSGRERENLCWGYGNGSVINFGSPHVVYNPEAPEWAGYPNPFEY